MSVIQDRLRKQFDDEKRIKDQVQAKATTLTQKEQESINQITRELSNEHFDQISEKGLPASSEALLQAAKEKVNNLNASTEEKARIEKNITENI